METVVTILVLQVAMVDVIGLMEIVCLVRKDSMDQIVALSVSNVAMDVIWKGNV